MAFVPTSIRACSITSNICAMPSCTSPSSQPTAGHAVVAPKVSSQVVDAFRPILCSTPVTNTPLRSPSSPVSGSKCHLGTRNSDRPLVPGAGAMPGPSGRASTMCTMFSVRSCSAEVMNRFTPVRCQLPVRLAHRPGPAGADVRTGVRLGEHHRRAPAPLDHELGPVPLLRGAPVVDHRGEGRPGQVEEGGRVGAEHQLGGGPLHRRRDAVAAQLGGQPEPPPLAVPRAPGRPCAATPAGRPIRWPGRTPAGAGRRRRTPAASGPVATRFSSPQQVPRGVLIQLVERRRCPSCPAPGRPRTG